MFYIKNNINRDFRDYLFVDECTVRVLELPLYHSRTQGNPAKSIPSSAKIRLKLNVCAGISYKGCTNFAVSL